MQVNCTRDDLVIDKVELKDKSGSIKDRFKANREVAAAAFLRSVLSSHGFDCDDFEEKLSELMLADISVQDEII